MTTARTEEIKPIQRTLTIAPKVMEKYNKENMLEVKFTSGGLDLLREKYKNVRGLPPFLHHTLKGRPTNISELILANSSLCTWTDDYSFIIFPNNCTSAESILKDPLAVKDNEYGLGLVAWSIAPGLLNKYGFQKKLDEEKIGDLLQDFLLKKSINSKIYTGYQYFHRSVSQETISEIESKNEGCHYLASILDLTKDDLAQLKNLKKTCLTHIQKIYGATLEKDFIEMYFHFPYPDSTTTLHLHIRINFGRHPMEKSRSFELDEVISALEQGKSIQKLILERNTYFADDFDILYNIPGIQLLQSKNPYVITSSYIKIFQSNLVIDAVNSGKPKDGTSSTQYIFKNGLSRKIDEQKILSVSKQEITAREKNILLLTPDSEQVNIKPKSTAKIEMDKDSNRLFYLSVNEKSEIDKMQEKMECKSHSYKKCIIL
jgi:hypothetical protein